MGAFGTLMALEPALGIVLVVVAGIGAERGGHREDLAPGSPPVAKCSAHVSTPEMPWHPRVRAH